MISEADRLKEPTRIANLRKRLQRIEQTKQRCREGGPLPDRRQIAALGSEQEIREEIVQWEQFGILNPSLSTPPTAPAPTPFPNQVPDLLSAAMLNHLQQHQLSTMLMHSNPVINISESPTHIVPSSFVQSLTNISPSTTSTQFQSTGQPQQAGISPTAAGAAAAQAVAVFPQLAMRSTTMDRDRIYALAYPTTERTEKEPTRIVNLRRRLQRILTTRERMETPGMPYPDNRQLTALAAEPEIVWEIEQWEGLRIIYPLKPEMKYIPPGALGIKGEKGDKSEKGETNVEGSTTPSPLSVVPTSTVAPPLFGTAAVLPNMGSQNLSVPTSEEVHSTRSLPDPSLMPIDSSVQHGEPPRSSHSEDAFSLLTSADHDKTSPNHMKEWSARQENEGASADVGGGTAWSSNHWVGFKKMRDVTSSPTDIKLPKSSSHEPISQPSHVSHSHLHSPYELPHGDDPSHPDITHSYVPCPASAATMANVESWAQSVRDARADAHRRRKQQPSHHDHSAHLSSSGAQHHQHQSHQSPTTSNSPAGFGTTHLQSTTATSSSSTANTTHHHTSGSGSFHLRAISPTKTVDLRQALLAKYIELKLDKIEGEHHPHHSTAVDHHGNTDSPDHFDHSAHSSFRRNEARERSASEPSDHELFDKVRSTSAEFLPSPFAFMGRRTNSFDDLTRPLSMDSLDSPLASPHGQTSVKRDAFRLLIEERVPVSPASRIRQRGGMLLETRFYGHSHHVHLNSSGPSSTVLSSTSSGDLAQAHPVDSDPEKSASPRSPDSIENTEGTGGGAAGRRTSTKGDSPLIISASSDTFDKWLLEHHRKLVHPHPHLSHSHHEADPTSHSSSVSASGHHRKPPLSPLPPTLPLQHQCPPAACLPGCATPTTGGSAFAKEFGATSSPPASDACGMSHVTIPSCTEGSWSIMADSGGGGHHAHAGHGGHHYARQPLPCLRRRSTHFLENSWTLWFNESLQPQHDDGHPAFAYEDSIIELGCFNTIEGFWMYWNNLRIACLVDNCNLRIFKTEIRPIWEDPHNVEGGRWVARHLPKSKRNKLWSDIVMAMVGELIEDNTCDTVCGVVLSTRDDGDMIQLWTDGGYHHRHKPDQVYRGDEYRQGLPSPQEKLAEIFHHDPDIHFKYQLHFPQSGTSSENHNHTHNTGHENPSSSSAPRLLPSLENAVHKDKDKDHPERLTRSRMELFLNKCGVIDPPHHSTHHTMTGVSVGAAIPTSTSPISYPSPISSPSHKTLSPLPPPPTICSSSAFISPISSGILSHPPFHSSSHHDNHTNHHDYYDHHHPHFFNEVPKETSVYGELDVTDGNPLSAAGSLASPTTPITPGTNQTPTSMPFEPLTSFSNQPQLPRHGGGPSGTTGRPRPRPPPVHTSPDSEGHCSHHTAAHHVASSSISQSQQHQPLQQRVAIMRPGPSPASGMGMTGHHNSMMHTAHLQHHHHHPHPHQPYHHYQADARYNHHHHQHHVSYHHSGNDSDGLQFHSHHPNSSPYSDSSI